MLLNDLNSDPDLLKRVIIADETWVCSLIFPMKATRTKKAHPICSNAKNLLTFFFDYFGMKHHEFLPEYRTINKGSFAWNITKTTPGLVAIQCLILHYYNALYHTSLFGRDFMAKMAPCAFFQFPKLKTPMK